MEEQSKLKTAFTYMPLGIFPVPSYALQPHRCPSDISEVDEQAIQWQGVGVSICIS